jgi:hypothetical protein
MAISITDYLGPVNCEMPLCDWATIRQLFLAADGGWMRAMNNQSPRAAPMQATGAGASARADRLASHDWQPFDISDAPDDGLCTKYAPVLCFFDLKASSPIDKKNGSSCRRPLKAGDIRREERRMCHALSSPIPGRLLELGCLGSSDREGSSQLKRGRASKMHRVM